MKNIYKLATTISVIAWIGTWYLAIWSKTGGWQLFITGAFSVLLACIFIMSEPDEKPMPIVKMIEGESVLNIDRRVKEKYPGWTYYISTIGIDGKPVIVLFRGKKNMTVTQTQLFNQK